MKLQICTYTCLSICISLVAAPNFECVYTYYRCVIYAMYVSMCIDLTNDKEDEDECSDEDHGEGC